jgi:pilus assembly protein CpaB
MARVKIVPVLIVVLAMGIAAVAALLAYNKLQNKPIVLEKGKGDTLRVAVAGLDLPWGTLIDEKMIKMEPYLKKSLPYGYFADRTALVGRTLRYPIKVNEPIFESRLAPPSSSGGIAAVLSPKKRALSVKVDKVIGVSGFISPGNRVDVLVTTKREKTDSASTSITKTVLENILVLAAGSEMGVGVKQEKKKVRVDVITLEVTPEEGEKLALATNKGTIQLALRNYSDTEEVITQGSTIRTLLASYSRSDLSKETKGTNKNENKNENKSMIRQELHTVTVIKGTNVNEVMF